jgi:AraC family transcriptional regulator of arabinose operon
LKTFDRLVRGLINDMEQNIKEGSYKNIWHGLGRQRIEIPKSVLKSSIYNKKLLSQFYICSLGYYPQAKDHYTYRKKGLPENFLFYCMDGHGWYQIGDNKYTVNPNEFFILPQNTEHAYGSEENNPWTIYWIHFGGELLPYFNQVKAVRNHYKPFHIKSPDEIVSLFSKIYKTLELGYSIDNLMFANMCLTYFLTLFIYNSKHYKTSATDKINCIDSAILYMKENINHSFSLQELSAHYNYSPSRFSGLFKQKTGYAPIDYFIQMKMQKATQLLDFTDKSIKEVASTFGFNDPYYFSRRFRKIIGMSPKKYRSINKD